MDKLTPDTLRDWADCLEPIVADEFGFEKTGEALHSLAAAWEADLRHLAEVCDDYLVRLRKLEETKPTVVHIQETYDLLTKVLARNGELEKVLAAIECAECEHDLRHCTCPGGLCYEEKP